MVQLRNWLFTFLFLLHVGALAQTSEENAFGPDIYDPHYLLEPADLEKEEPLPEGYFESSYALVSRRVIGLANKVDSIFGDRRALDEYDGSTMKVTQEFRIGEDGFSSNDLQLSLNLKLPNLRQVEKSVTDRFITEGAEIIGAKPGEDDEALAKRRFSEANPWEFNQETGLRTRIPLSYYALVRARKNFLTAPFVHHYYAQLGWDTDTEWLQKMGLSSDYAFSENLLFRFVNEQYWEMTNHVFGVDYGPSLIQKINDFSAISYDARALTLIQKDNWYINNYTLSTTYRIAFAKRRLFLELKPEISYPKIDDHEFNWNFYISLEVLFGRASS